MPDKFGGRFMPSYRARRIIRSLHLWEFFLLILVFLTCLILIVFVCAIVIVLGPPYWVLYPDMRFHTYSSGSQRERQILERYRRLGVRMSLWRRMAKLVLNPFGLWKTYW